MPSWPACQASLLTFHRRIGPSGIFYWCNIAIIFIYSSSFLQGVAQRVFCLRRPRHSPHHFRHLFHARAGDLTATSRTMWANPGDHASAPCQLSSPALVGRHTHHQVHHQLHHPRHPHCQRQDKPAVALAEGEEAQAEALLKIECKTNLESSTDTILFQVLHLSIIIISNNFPKIWFIHHKSDKWMYGFAPLESCSNVEEIDPDHFSGEAGHRCFSVGNDVFPWIHSRRHNSLLQPSSLDIVHRDLILPCVIPYISSTLTLSWSSRPVVNISWNTGKERMIIVILVMIIHWLRASLKSTSSTLLC